MAAQHTPAPWKLAPSEVMEDDSVYPPHIVGGARDLVICTLMDMTSDAMCESATDVRSKRANVRLITAAPDLLEALSEVLMLIQSACPEYAESTVCANARAVIATATSES